eukprot:scaffold297713_cov43-Prasinocladus_malaysianus.AAC.1
MAASRPKVQERMSTPCMWWMSDTSVSATAGQVWLESAERKGFMSEACRKGLFEPGTMQSQVQVGGGPLMIDYIWTNEEAGEARQGGAKLTPYSSEPELATWRVVYFTVLNVWFAVVVLNWPVGSLGTVVSGLPMPVALLFTQMASIFLGSHTSIESQSTKHGP